jgi:Icc-related predicted phosphoesterase
MRVLCISDIHSNFAAFDPASMPEAEICIVAGDVTEYGHSRQRTHGKELRAAKEWLASLGRRYPTFVIPGNHDIRVRNSDFDGIAGVTGILGLRADCLGRSLYGVSLCPAYDFPRMARVFDFMTIDHDEENAAYDFEPVDIVVSHCPPYGILDHMRDKDSTHPGPHIGSEALLRYIGRHNPKLVVCGHVHNDPGQRRIGETLVVNAAKTWTVVNL